MSSLLLRIDLLRSIAPQAPTAVKLACQLQAPSHSNSSTTATWKLMPSNVELYLRVPPRASTLTTKLMAVL
eukprot:3173206-Pleurochrysis_carterae.AAC.7